MNHNRKSLKIALNSASDNALHEPGSAGETFTIPFNPPLILDPNLSYGVRLVCAQFIYSFPNIDETNNKFVFEYNGGAPVTITVPDGLYTFPDLASTIASMMVPIGFGTIGAPVFDFLPNPSTALVALVITAGHTLYAVRWDLTTMSDILGFPTSTVTLPPNPVAPQIEWGTLEENANRGVDTCCIQASLIKGSFRDGVSTNTLVTIPLANVEINGFHAHYPQSDTWSPLVDTTINEITISLTDGRGRPLKNRGLHYGVEIAIDLNAA